MSRKQPPKDLEVEEWEAFIDIHKWIEHVRKSKLRTYQRKRPLIPDETSEDHEEELIRRFDHWRKLRDRLLLGC